MHGPPPSWFGGLPMLWPAFPRIPVLDTIAAGLRPRKAAKWRANRTTMLTDWGAAGIFFDVFEEDPAEHTKWDPNYADEETELRRHIVPGFFRLMRGTYDVRVQGTAWSYPTPPGSVALFRIDSVWWVSTSPWRRQFVVTHESGHALGLNHRSDSTASVMYSVGGYGGPSNDPDAHDLDSLEDAYGGN